MRIPIGAVVSPYHAMKLTLASSCDEPGAVSGVAAGQEASFSAKGSLISHEKINKASGKCAHDPSIQNGPDDCTERDEEDELVKQMDLRCDLNGASAYHGHYSLPTSIF